MYLRLLVDSEPNVKGDVIQVPDSRANALVENGTAEEITSKEAKEAIEKNTAQNAGEEVDEEEENGDDKYDAMDGPALKEELKKRELAVSGKVDELRERLREDDAKKAE